MGYFCSRAPPYQEEFPKDPDQRSRAVMILQYLYTNSI